MPPRFGIPLNIRIRSTESVLVVEPVLGLDVSQPSVDAPLGSTPESSNYVMRDGALEPRPMLARRGVTSQPFGNSPILGGHELVSVANVKYPLVSGTTRLATYGQAANPNDWSVLSYVSSYGLNDPPALAATNYWDWTQIYSADRDENWAVGAAESYQTLYVTQSNTTVFSSLTGAPAAKYVAAYDNYLLAFNMREGSADLVQRVRWNDRGSASSWTGGLAGFEDLLAMKGQGTKIVTQDGALRLFSDQEIWQGVPGDVVAPFRFAPYDTSRGAPYSGTITQTPAGTIFLGRDYQLYLLPSGGGPSQGIGGRLHQKIRNEIDFPERAWSVYDNTLSQYQLFYPIRGGSGYPEKAVYLDMQSGSLAPQTFTHSVTRGVEIEVSSSATTYGGLQAAGIRFADLNMTYGQLAGTSQGRAVLVGTSSGTLAYFNSAATNDLGSAVESKWRSTGLAGEDPSHQKSVNEWRVDYQADSSSSLTVRFSTTLGATFGNSVAVDMPSASVMSQAIVHTYHSVRHPMFEVSSEGQRYRLYRFWVQFRRGGR
jgi:hypothetical protein